MKRLLGFVLLMLVLCGCTVRLPDETVAISTETTVEKVIPTEPAGIYESGSDLEICTNGAVRSFLPQLRDCYGMRIIGGDILLFSGTDKTRLTRLAGENLFAVADTQLDFRVEPEDTSFQISTNGITCFDPQAREVIFLDHDLKEVSRLSMPEDMLGRPVLSSNRRTVYYCTSDAVRVFDLEVGLDKLLKRIAYPQQYLEDVLLDDSILRCRLVDENGQEYALFLSAETGETLAQERQEIRLSTWGDTFYASFREGITHQLLFGAGRESMQALYPRELNADAWFLEAEHGAVTLTAREENSVLDYYDLESGLRTATVELPGNYQPLYLEASADARLIYIFALQSDAREPVLLCWERGLSGVADDTVYTGPRYTLESPDEAGLEACRSYAAALSEVHGVEILIGLEAVQEQPWDYVLEPEYQVPVIFQELKKLETCLEQYPRGFFAQLYGTPRICLVRSIRGSAQSGSVEAASGLQFWQEDREIVALAAGQTLQGAFFHEMFHVLDGKILSDSRTYYDWHRLNPAGCSYFENYTDYLTADLGDYLEDETRVFIDAYSACFPKEDRARIMEYACQEGNTHYFQSEVMQKKLKTLCQGIREVFGLETYQEPLLWEQYLAEALNTK